MSDSFDPYYKWLGIPPAEQPPHHYALLGIAPFEADPDVIANAADQRMGHLRNFQIGPRAALSQQLLNELAAARLRLLSADKKQQYDAALRTRITSTAAPKPPPAAAVVRPAAVLPLKPQLAPLADALPATEYRPRVRRRAKSNSLAVQITALSVVLLSVTALYLAFSKSKTSELTADSRRKSTKSVAKALPGPAAKARSTSQTEEPTSKPAKGNSGSQPQPIKTEFLSDLVAEDVRRFGYVETASYVVDGVASPHALWMQPGHHGYAHMRYSLSGRWRTLTGTAAIEDSVPDRPRSLVVFRVVGDGRLLWRSLPVGQAHLPQPVQVDVTGVERLELFVDCPGQNHLCYAVWAEPRLSTSPLESAPERPKKTPRLEILEARYGAGNQWMDVTDFVRARLPKDQLIFHRFELMVAADPAPNKHKSLVVRYRIDGQEDATEFAQHEFAAIWAPTEPIPAAQQRGLVILDAGFGTGDTWLDLTKKIQPLVKDGRLEIPNHDELHQGEGDPAFGIHKVVYVRYLLDGVEKLEHFSGQQIKIGP